MKKVDLAILEITTALSYFTRFQNCQVVAHKQTEESDSFIYSVFEEKYKNEESFKKGNIISFAIFSIFVIVGKYQVIEWADIEGQLKQINHGKHETFADCVVAVAIKPIYKKCGFIAGRIDPDAKGGLASSEINLN